MSLSVKRALRKQIEVQRQMINTLEEQVLVMGDVAKIKDLIIQSLVGAMGTNVSKEEIEKIINKDEKEATGSYL